MRRDHRCTDLTVTLACSIALAACSGAGRGAHETDRSLSASARPEAEPSSVSPAPPADPAPSAEPSAEIADPGAVLMLDTHVDTPQRLLDSGDDLSQRLADGHLDLPRMREGGLSGAFFSIWVDPRRYPGEQAWDRARALSSAIRDFVRSHSDEVALCTSAAEVRAARASGRIAFLMGIEGAHALGEAEPDVLLERLRTLHREGARYMTITWTHDNLFGHASTGAHPSRGLTDLGRRAVAEMNRLGMIVDVSHVSDRTASDVLEVSTRPVLASHSSARALADHPRNVPDALVRRIAAAGGAICVNFYAHFLDPDYGARRRALEREHRSQFAAFTGRSWQTARDRNALARTLAPDLRPPSISVIVDHLAHITRLGGPGAACLGSDFDGVSELPAGLDDASDLARLAHLIEERGLPLRAIAGQNVLRVLEAQAR